MKISLRKIVAIMKLKMKMLVNNIAALTGPLMAIGMTILMKVLYTSLMADGDPSRNQALMGMALNLGLSMNIGMGGIMMTTLPLAEDKEKNTLRSLLTSSVNGTEFFIGSLLPPFMITSLVNFIIIYVSSVDISQFNMALFAGVTLLGSLTSCILGLLLGVYAKNQMNASNIIMPFALVLALLPTFAMFSPVIDTISNFLYTGIVEKMVTGFTSAGSFALSIQQTIILIGGALLLSVLFVIAYRKKGLQSE